MANSAYDIIEEANFTGSATSLTFTAIPQTYQHLRMIGSICTAASGGSTTDDTFYMRVNGDSTTGTYQFTRLIAGAASTFYGADDTNADAFRLGIMAGDRTENRAYSPLMVDIWNYAESKPSSYSAFCGFPDSDSGSYDGYVNWTMGTVAKSGSGSDWGISEIELYWNSLNPSSTSRVSLIGMSVS